ncbi:hypothetical protein EDC96DRAFT_496130 [Choanephora cucurbitarum]|nr:hypothetical protein EDC96DRAFT_496130 [Choanephora cucurbitarum]
MNHFPGYTELKSYIEEENPSFKGFVVKYTIQIMTEWKVAGLKSPSVLLEVWKSRYYSEFSLVHPDQQSIRSRVDKRTWFKLYYQYNPEEKETAPTCTTARSITKATSSMKLSTSNTGLKRKFETHVSLRMKDVAFEPITIVNEWMLKESNMSSMFIEYQKTSRQYCLDHDGSLKMSKDINELLSLSGILLLEEDKMMSESLLKHFTKTQLKDAYNQVRDSYEHVEVEAETIKQIMKCLKKSDDEERDLLFPTLRKNTSNPSTKKAIIAIQSLLTFLPDDSEKEMNEYTLASTVIHPVLMPLLKGPGINPLPCNGLVHESSRVDNSRPDFRCDVYEEGKLAYSNLFGELKSNCSKKEGQYLDLYRIMLFSKNVIDKKNKNKIMSFRTVGPKVWVYMLELLYDGMYVAVELFSFSLPTLKSQATMAASVVDELVDMHNIYYNNSSKELSENLKKSKVLPYDALLNSLSNTTEL